MSSIVGTLSASGEKIGQNFFCWQLFKEKSPNGYSVRNMMKNTKQFHIIIDDTAEAKVFDATPENTKPDFIMDEIMMKFCQLAADDLEKRKIGVNE